MTPLRIRGRARRYLDFDPPDNQFQKIVPTAPVRASGGAERGANSRIHRAPPPTKCPRRCARCASCAGCCGRYSPGDEVSGGGLPGSGGSGTAATGGNVTGRGGKVVG